MKRAFTLVEIILSMSLLMMLFAISIPIYQSFQFRTEVDTSVNKTVRALRTAQLYAQVSEGDSDWGVKVQNSQIIVFKGANFAARDPNFGHSFNMPSRVGVSGSSEIVFSKFTGKPIAAATLTLSEPILSRQITINSEGAINY